MTVEERLSNLPAADGVEPTDVLYLLTANGGRQVASSVLAGVAAAIVPTGETDPITVQRKLEHYIDLRDYIPAGQHSAIYSGTSDYDAIDDINWALNETIEVNGGAGPSIVFPYGKLLLSEPLQLKKVVSLRGHGNPADGSFSGTILSWPALTGAAIYVNRHDTLGEDTVESGGRADGGLIQGLSLEGPGGYDDTGLSAGIRLRARARLVDVSVSGFAGDGINGKGASGNVNTMWVDRVRSGGNGRHGIYMDGGDSNAGTFVGVSCNDNGGYGIADSSFLGNTWIGGHLDGNGLKGQVSHGGNRYYLLSGDGAATEPGTNSAVWVLVGEGGVHAQYPAWSSEGVYIRGGSIMSDNANARSLFIGHYMEPSQPPSYVRNPAIYMPGHDTNGLTPDSTCLSIKNRTLDRANFTRTTIPTYADNAAAVAGGLSAGDMYKTATGEVRVRV